LAGADLIDASGEAHPGLIPIGVSILGASAADLMTLREKAAKAGLDVVDFPSQGQQTNNYAEFGELVSRVSSSELTYVGVGVYGPRKAVGKVVGKFFLLK
jgi:hypothetical protein